MLFIGENKFVVKRQIFWIFKFPKISCIRIFHEILNPSGRSMRRAWERREMRRWETKIVGEKQKRGQSACSFRRALKCLSLRQKSAFRGVTKESGITSLWEWGDHSPNLSGFFRSREGKICIPSLGWFSVKIPVRGIGTWLYHRTRVLLKCRLINCYVKYEHK